MTDIQNKQSNDIFERLKEEFPKGTFHVDASLPEWFRFMKHVESIQELSKSANFFSRKFDSTALQQAKIDIQQLFLNKFNINDDDVWKEYSRYLEFGNYLSYSHELMTLVYHDGIPAREETLEWKVQTKDIQAFLLDLLEHTTRPGRALSFYFVYRRNNLITPEIQTAVFDKITDIILQDPSKTAYNNMFFKRFFDGIETPLTYARYQKALLLPKEYTQDNPFLNDTPINADTFIERYSGRQEFLYMALKHQHVAVLDELFIPLTIDGNVKNLYTNHFLAPKWLADYLTERSLETIQQWEKDIPHLKTIMQWQEKHETVHALNPECLFKDTDKELLNPTEHLEQMTEVSLYLN